MHAEHPVQPPPLPPNEAERLAALHAFKVVGTPPEAEYDDLAVLAAELCEAPIALVSLIDRDRQWLKARVGLDLQETARAEFFCSYALLQHEVFEVPDACADPRFARNPLVIQPPHVRFYAAAPLRGEHDLCYGTVCVLDVRPRVLSPTQRRQLQRLAALAVKLLEARRAEYVAANHAVVLSTLLDAMPGAVISCDAQGTFELVNGIAREWFAALGSQVPMAEWSQRFSLYDPEGRGLLPVNCLPLVRALRGEVVRDFDMSIRPPGAAPRYVRCHAGPVRVDHQVEGGVLIMSDVTDLLSAQHSLEQERRDLEVVLSGTDAGTWKLNLQTREAVINARFAQMCGYQLAELAPFHMDQWRPLMHPEDLPIAEAAMQAHVQGRTAMLDHVYRVRHKDGHWLWVHSRGRIYEWDAAGRPLWIAGTHVDISRLKQVEAESEAARAYLRSIIDAASSVAILATDLAGTITVCNSGAEHLLGYRAEEVVNQAIPMGHHLPEELEARRQELGLPANASFFDVLVHAARRGETETRHWTLLRKDGQRRQMRLTVGPLWSGKQELIGFVAIGVDLTEQREAEAEAKVAADRFTRAFNSAATGIALADLEGRWLEVNGSLCRKLGYSAEELRSMTVRDVTHPDDVDLDRDEYQALLQGRISDYRVEKRYLRKNGEVIWFLLSASLAHDAAGRPLHLVLQFKNTTEERLAKQALQASELRLRGLFQLSPIGIALHDFRTGKFLDANAALLQQTGYTREELDRLRDHELWPEEHRGQELQALKEAVATGRFGPLEGEHVRKDGTRYPVRVQGLLVNDIDGRSVVWTLIEDISAQKRVDRMKQEFVSTVSHELRTPLTSISGALSLINGGALGEVPEAMREMLEIAGKNSRRLAQLVNDLLDMEKLLAGKMHFEPERVSLPPLLDEALLTMTSYAQLFAVQLRREGEDPVILHVDPTRLLQVITNLLSNACKHSPRGATVLLRHEVQATGVVISVRDQGRGIPAAFRSRIFQKFAQAEASDSRAVDGTGLGLAICKALVEQMGGAIAFESQEGRGAEFWLRLPAEGRSLRAPPPLRRPRLLQLQRDARLADRVSAQLVGQGAMETVATSPQLVEALHRAQYDLILLDLPPGTAADLAALGAIAETHPLVPVVILSGHEVPRVLAPQVALVLTHDELGSAHWIGRVHALLEREDAGP